MGFNSWDYDFIHGDPIRAVPEADITLTPLSTFKRTGSRGKYFEDL
jgi:hypothetical protein